jgi:hypothetical protein
MYIKKYCCDKNTQFATKMKNCESTLHTIAGYITSNRSIDHIVSIETHPTMHVTDETILNILVTDHKPIFCKVNGIPILSWNIEGLCNKLEEHELRLQKIIYYLSEIHKKHPNIIFMFQELFLQSVLSRRNYKMGIDRLHMLFHHPDYTYIYDNYTGGIIIPTHLYYKNIQLITRKDSKKECMVLYVRASQPFYLINVHLKAVKNPIFRNTTHIDELSNILLNVKHKFKKGIIFIGDHNNSNVLELYHESLKSISV